MKKRGVFTWVMRWGPALLGMAAIFWLSSTPSQELPQFGVLDLLVKKGGHFSGYAILTLAFLRGLGMERRQDGWLALLLALLYAASDELHQSLVAGRHSSPVDVGIDLAGAVFAILLAQHWRPLKRLVLAWR